MAPLFAYLNGIQRHPYCRPIGGPIGFDPRRQRIDHTAFVACAVGDTHHHGTRRKAQVRLASAGSLLTAVALELVAGKTWAAGLTRKPARCSIATRQRAASNSKSHQLLSAEEADSDAPWSRKSHTDSTDGMLVTRGRGHRPRVGPPLGHPGPVAGRQNRTKRSTWPQSRAVARGPPCTA